MLVESPAVYPKTPPGPTTAEDVLRAAFARRRTEWSDAGMDFPTERDLLRWHEFDAATRSLEEAHASICTSARRSLE